MECEVGHAALVFTGSLSFAGQAHPKWATWPSNLANDDDRLPRHLVDALQGGCAIHED